MIVYGKDKNIGFIISEYKKSRRMTEPTKWPLRLAKTQISLGIRSVVLSFLANWENNLKHKFTVIESGSKEEIRQFAYL